MQPIKAFLPVSIWLMRTGLLFFAYEEYFKTFSDFHLSKVEFYIAALFLIFSAIIFITGFIKKITLTVISGFAITLLSIYNLIGVIDKGLNMELIIYLMIAGIAIYFISNPSSK